MKSFLWITGVLCGTLLSCMSSQAQPKRGDVIFQTNFDAPDALKAWQGLKPQARLDTGHQGSQALRIETTEAANDVQVRIPLPVAGMRGARVKFEALVKAENVAKPPQPYNGIKVMLHTVYPTGKGYPQRQNVFGTFDWMPVSAVTAVSEQATEAYLVLGIEKTTGVAWFDNVKVTISAAPRTRPAQPPTGPVYKGHNLPRLRGAMVSGGINDEGVRVLGREWNANVARYQLAWWGSPNNPSRADDEAAYDAWLAGATQKLDVFLDRCERDGLLVVIDLHTPPGGKKDKQNRMFVEKKWQDKLLAVWDDLSRRYRNHKAVYGYDIVNEPSEGDVADGLMNWNELAAAVAKVIRRNDPEHAIIIEPEMGGDPAAIRFLEPVPVPGVVYSIHMYIPFSYTHQGVVEGKPMGVKYPGESEGKTWNKEMLRQSLQPVIEFQRDHNVQIYVGEFGVARWAEGSAQWLQDTIEIFEELGWDWSYHAFREWQGWNAEIGTDPKDTTLLPMTDRKQVILSWLAKNRKPDFYKP